jgi:hypothetical protein
MARKIRISTDLFDKTLELLSSLDDYLDMGGYHQEVALLHGYVFHAFMKKKLNMDCREVRGGCLPVKPLCSIEHSCKNVDGLDSFHDQLCF